MNQTSLLLSIFFIFPLLVAPTNVEYQFIIRAFRPTAKALKSGELIDEATCRVEVKAIKMRDGVRQKYINDLYSESIGVGYCDEDKPIALKLKCPQNEASYILRNDLGHMEMTPMIEMLYYTLASNREHVICVINDADFDGKIFVNLQTSKQRGEKSQEDDSQINLQTSKGSETSEPPLQLTIELPKIIVHPNRIIDNYFGPYDSAENHDLPADDFVFISEDEIPYNIPIKRII